MEDFEIENIQGNQFCDFGGSVPIEIETTLAAVRSHTDEVIKPNVDGWNLAGVWPRELTSGRKLENFALTEPQSGSDATNMYSCALVNREERPC